MLQKNSVPGPGTPGKTVKGAWRSTGREVPLREWARHMAKDMPVCAEWLASKRHGGTDEQRKERKLMLRERHAINLAARAARRAKRANKQQQKKKGADDSRR